MDKKKIFQRTNFLLFLLCSLIILIEAALPGNNSSSQSNFVSNIISNIYNAAKNISNHNIYPTSLDIIEVNEAYTSSSFQLEYTVLPENATFKNVIFESSNPSIASIDEKGFITCLKEGTVDINCKMEINEKNILIEKKFALNIIDVLPTSIHFTNPLQNDQLIIKENEFVYLNVDIFPSTTTNRDIEYFIKDNSSFVYENESLKLDGNILHITNYSPSNPIYEVWAFSIADNSIYDVIKIKQEKDEDSETIIGIEGIKINLNEDLYVNQTYDLNVSFLPANTNQRYVKYETDYPNASISNEGQLIINKKTSDFINIKVTSLSDQSIFTNVTLKVKNRLGFEATISSKQKDNIFLLENKCSYQININYFANTTYKDVQITSSNPSIVKVYDNNTLSVLQKGKCTLHITSVDEGESYEQTIEINVINKDFAKEIKSFTLIIRKAFGHFLLFTFSALFLSLFLLSTLSEKEVWISLIVSELSGLYLAFFSELIQYFTPERACTILDVGIDFLGFNLGILIIFSIFFIKLLIKKYQKNKEKK
ncbi:MAG: VanZ family protein [Bacilli bacterium]